MRELDSWLKNACKVKTKYEIKKWVNFLTVENIGR